jgi:hypothetical protein
MLRTQAVGMRPCRPRSGLLTWHPSASTADSLLSKFAFICPKKKSLSSLKDKKQNNYLMFHLK